MDFDEELELVFTRTELISSFYQNSILHYYNELKNRLLKTNKWYQRVEISPISQIYTNNIVQYKERWTKDVWNNHMKNYYKNNTDGDWIFNYQATYEKSFFVEKKYKNKFKPGDEYFYEKDLMYELRQEENGGDFFKYDPDKDDDSPDIYVRVENQPKEPEHLIQEKLEYKLKLKKWIKEHPPLEDRIGLSLDFYEPWTAGGEDYWRVEFEDNYDKVKLSQDEINDYKKKVKEDQKKNLEEIEKEKQKVIDSWK